MKPDEGWGEGNEGVGVAVEKFKGEGGRVEAREDGRDAKEESWGGKRGDSVRRERRARVGERQGEKDRVSGERVERMGAGV